MPELIDAVKAWVNQPFRSTMSLWGWIAFGIVLGLVTIVWKQTVDHIRE